MNTHGGLANRLLWMQSEYQLTEADRVLQKTPYSFDVSVWEFFWPLITGARLVMARPGGHQDPRYLAETIQAHQITTLHFVPSMLQAFVAEPEVAQCESVRQVISSGEALSFELQERFFGRLQGKLHNLYGPTEAAIDVTAWECQRGGGARSVPIGRPIANTQIYLLDERLQPVPVGVAGELHIGGIGVGRGYLNRPELTAEKFVPNPYAAGQRLYKTGDLARYLGDGSIEYLGRLDDQVKIRGFRIELGEIAEVLRQHAGVSASAVVVREDTAGERRLVAYVVRAEAELKVKELREYLRRKFPEYMLPAAIVEIKELPLTPSGKLDRRALPPPQYSLGLEARFEAPHTPTEEVLASIWTEILKVERVGIHDNFFELGGHSLLATQVVSRIREVFRIELPLRLLFELPRIADLGEVIEKRRRNEEGAPPPRLVPTSRREKLLPSFAQQRLWLLDQLEEGSSFYHISKATRLHGNLNVDALSSALNEIVRRHEPLRTSFVSIDGQPLQQIEEPQPVSISVFEVGPMPKTDRDDEVRRLAVLEIRKPFDLSRGPLLRASLIKTGQEEFVFVLTIHHIAGDAWSLSILFKELSVLYAAFAQGQPSPLPDLKIQFVDFAVWQRSWLEGEILEKHLTYWRKKLEGAPRVLELPADRARPVVNTFRGAKKSAELSPSITQALNKLSRREGVTLFMTLLAAFKTLLWRYTGQEDMVVGSPIAGRNRAETEQLIGFFVNSLVLRTDLSGNPEFLELLRRVRETALEAYANQDLPFDKLVEVLQPERSLSHTPLFQVAFALQNAPRTTLDLPGLKLEGMGIENQTSKFDLMVFVVGSEQKLSLTFEYNTDLFDDVRIDRMIEHFNVLLESVVAQPEARISELKILPDAERQRLLVHWNNTRTEFPEDLTIHRMFEEQVNRDPNQVAFIYEDQRLTYGELNARANQLACYLLKQGVEPETRVGIYLNRSLEMVIGLLAVLKAGGAYVSLDPASPRERLAFMIDDADLAVLLTEEKLLTELPSHHAKVVVLDSEWELIRQNAQENLVIECPAGNLAYVIYTSGSTGTPKGVLGLHRATINRLHWMWQTYPFAPGEVCCQKTSLSFVDSIWEIFGPLLQGVPNVILQDEVVKDPDRLIESLSVNKVSRIVLVPSLLSVVLEEGREIEQRLSTLKYWVCSGETLPVDLAQNFRRKLPHGLLINLYGSSEVAADVSCYEVKNSEGLTSIPIGRPIANTQIYILDSNLEPAPVGIPGELYVGGEGLARGYLNRPELTAERFIPNPFSDDLHARLYRTGDVARYLGDGNIEYVGRIDRQIKIRGFRIELGEIEAVLREHPSVRDSVLVARIDIKGDRQLVAYVVSNDVGAEVDSEELREYLERKLPEYMLPAAIVGLEELPLTPSGKVDRSALPVPDYQAQLKQAYVAPRTPTEEILAGIWAELLNVSRVGINDNFFALGGHSLLAMRLVARIRELFKTELPLRQVFESPTVSRLASEIVSRQHGPNRPPTLSIQRSDPDARELLAKIDQLSDEEVASLLQGMSTEGVNT